MRDTGKQAPASTFFLLVAGLVLVGCGSHQPPQAAAPEAVTGLSLVPVIEETVQDFVEAVGTVRAARTSQISSQLMANILEVRVSEGSRVRRGDLLVVLDFAQPQAGLDRAQAALRGAEQAVAAAEADYELATATLKRYQDLWEKRSVSAQEFDEVAAHARAATARREMARAHLEETRAAVAQAKTQLDHTRIRAPFDGLVTQRHVDPGALATPGMPLLMLEDTQRLRLEVSVNERDIALVQPQASVPVRIEALGEESLPGRVVQIVPAADPGSRSFIVKVELPRRPAVRSGVFGRALFPRGERPALLIPVAAVVNRGQLQGVYVVSDDRPLSLRYVTLGNPIDEKIEVLSGLEAGEVIVGNPGERDLAAKRVESSQP